MNDQLAKDIAVLRAHADDQQAFNKEGKNCNRYFSPDAVRNVCAAAERTIAPASLQEAAMQAASEIVETTMQVCNAIHRDEVAGPFNDEMAASIILAHLAPVVEQERRKAKVEVYQKTANIVENTPEHRTRMSMARFLRARANAIERGEEL